MIPTVMIATIGSLVVVAMVVLGVRNEMVYRYRVALIDRCFLHWEAMHKASDPRSLEWYELARQARNQVSHHRMVFQFWRRCADFYRGTILDSEGLL